MTKKSLQEIDRIKRDSAWTSEDVAKFLGVSRSTVRCMVHRKQLPHKKVGNKLYFSELAIREKFLG